MLERLRLRLAARTRRLPFADAHIERKYQIVGEENEALLIQVR
jgi:hypothetical protein